MRHDGAGLGAASGAGSARSGRRALGLRSVNGVVAVAGPGGLAARPALAAEVAGAVRLPGRGNVVVPRVGLVFPSRLPFEAWQGIGAQLAAAAACSAWCLGDWLVYGQAAYAGRYREAVERTGLDYQTLRNYAWVAGRFELSRRRDTLSFGHHAEVAALPGPEQDFWLRKAEEFGWPVMRLRHEVRSSLAERGQARPGLESAGDSRRGGVRHDRRPAEIRVTLTPGQLALCQRAAGQDGVALHAWAARALERAASEQLAAPG
jgi:hypothetical protein